MSWKVTTSRAAEGEDSWYVTVLDEDGVTVGEVCVRIAERARRSGGEEIASLRESKGRSAVREALAADPTALPKEIVVGLEGSQPILAGQEPAEGGRPRGGELGGWAARGPRPTGESVAQDRPGNPHR